MNLVTHSQLPLLELTRLIVDNSDHSALEHFHNERKVFFYKDDKPLRLVELLDRLRQGNHARQWCGQDSTAVDKAYDLTLGKFSLLPDGQEESSIPAGICDRNMKKDGPDCRYYFGAFVEYADRKLQAKVEAGRMDRELRAAQLMQNFVVRHFRFSCLECRRQAQQLLRRYAWQVNGRSISLWLPIDIPGDRCRSWLENNITDVDPTRPAERDRIQARVDQLLRRPRLLSLEELGNEVMTKKTYRGSQPDVLDQEIFHVGLATVIADEKADNIKQQRPTIQQLGKEKLKQMIHAIFDDLANGRYIEGALADRFGLSKATFSRFAGSRWSDQEQGTGKTAIPDLWCNTAGVLANHPDFMETAQKAGVWKRVCDVLDNQKIRSYCSE